MAQDFDASGEPQAQPRRADETNGVAFKANIGSSELR